MRFTRRKWLFSSVLIAAGALLIAGAWHYLFSRDRPARFVGTWKLESPTGQEQLMRYQFDADGSLWTSVGDSRTPSEWYVSGGELVVVTEDEHRSLVRLLGDLAARFSNPDYAPNTIRFAVEGSADWMRLTPTNISGIKPSFPDSDVFIRAE